MFAEETFAVLRFLAKSAKVYSRKKFWKLSTAKVYSRKKFEIYQPQKKKFILAKKIDFFITLLATHGFFSLYFNYNWRIWLEVGGFHTFFVYNFSEPQKFFPAKKMNFGEPQKFIPAKCKNFAVFPNRKSFFREHFLPLKYLHNRDVLFSVITK